MEYRFNESEFMIGVLRFIEPVASEKVQDTKQRNGNWNRTASPILFLTATSSILRNPSARLAWMVCVESSRLLKSSFGQFRRNLETKSRVSRMRFHAYTDTDTISGAPWRQQWASIEQYHGNAVKALAVPAKTYKSYPCIRVLLSPQIHQDNMRWVVTPLFAKLFSEYLHSILHIKGDCLLP